MEQAKNPIGIVIDTQLYELAIASLDSPHTQDVQKCRAGIWQVIGQTRTLSLDGEPEAVILERTFSSTEHPDDVCVWIKNDPHESGYTQIRLESFRRFNGLRMAGNKAIGAYVSSSTISDKMVSEPEERAIRMQIAYLRLERAVYESQNGSSSGQEDAVTVPQKGRIHSVLGWLAGLGSNPRAA